MKPQTESKMIKLQKEWSKDQVFNIGKFTIEISHIERIRDSLINNKKFQKDSLSLDISHNGKSVLHSYLYGESEI